MDESDLIEAYYYNDVYFRCRAERSILSEMSEYFTFKSPKFYFNPRFRNKQWDGRIRLFKIMTGELYNGLYPNLLKFAEDRGYKVKHIGKKPIQRLTHNPDISQEQVAQFIQDLNYRVVRDRKSVPLELYDYQKKAIYDAIALERQVFLSATNSGKSAIIYGMLRWFTQHTNRRYLLVVPTTALVEQMYKDFSEYAAGTGWQIDKNVQKIYEGHTKKLTHPIVVSTWQSIYKFDPEWFEPFGGGISDECHLAKADSLKGIFEKMKDCPVKIGLTGTLDNEKLHKLVLQGMFGPINTVVTTKELVDSKRAARPKIRFTILKYSDDDRKALKKLKAEEEARAKETGKPSKAYKIESDFIINHPKRQKFIQQLALMQKKNTLLLFHFIEKHGVPMYENAKKAAPDRPIYYISGKVETDEREEIRHAIEDDENALLYASYKTLSTGTNIRKLANLVFTYPFEAKILNLQSIGRVIRLHESKKHVNVYDLVDDLTYKTKKGATKNNYMFKHFLQRLETFKAEGFDIEFITVDLEKL